VVAVLLFAGFSVGLDGFLTSANILNLIRNVAMLGMLSLGMAVVVIGRGVDLSLVAVMAVSLTFSIVLRQPGI
jgi:ribose transport system permease protein